MPPRNLQLQFLSEEELDQIEATAYRLLDEVGIELAHDGVQEMLYGLGCGVEKKRTTIPGNVVRWALDNVAPDNEAYNLDGSAAFVFGDGQVRFHNGGGQPHALDLHTGAIRPATLQDVAQATRLLDALPNVDHITPLFGAQDVPPQLLFIESTAAMLRNTRKPISSAAIDKPEDVPYVVEMAAACCGGMEAFRRRPNLSISISPISPLKFTREVAGAIAAVARSGAPFHSLPAPSLGATSPVTMAGALAQQHAEVLASLVIAAAARPGTPVVYCSRISPMDMRTATSMWGGPEVGMTGACAAQLAHRLGLPCDSYGLSTSSHLLDPQFAYERLANALVPALAGVDMLSGVGNGGGLVAGCEIAALDDEIVGLIKHIAAGCEVNETTLAYEVMQRVIPGDAVFMGEMHTVRQLRRGALWIPTVGVHGGDAAEPGIGVVAQARARARELLRTHEVEPLADDASRHLDEIVERARQELVRH